MKSTLHDHFALALAPAVNHGPYPRRVMEGHDQDAHWDASFFYRRLASPLHAARAPIAAAYGAALPPPR